MQMRHLLPLWWRQPLKGMTYTSGPFAGLKPVTIVTGGSEGIGFALAGRFAAAGDDVLIIARHQDRLERAAAQIRVQHGGNVVTLALDITQPDAVQVIDQALAQMGGYAHVLVNNAGTGLAGAFAEQGPDDLVHMLNVNTIALTTLMRHVLPGMRSRGSGGVLNLASLGGYVPGPWQAAYYASKAYVLSLSEAVAAEVAPDGVRVCAVAPGPVDTRFHVRMRGESAHYRRLLPPLQPATVAWWAHHAFRLGLRVIVPDFINMIMSLGLRVIPHRVLMPVVGWLLRPRRRESGDA